MLINKGKRAAHKERVSPHRREQPLADRSTPIERWLITGICCSLCCVHATGEAGVFSPGVEVGVGE